MQIRFFLFPFFWCAPSRSAVIDLWSARSWQPWTMRSQAQLGGMADGHIHMGYIGIYWYLRKDIFGFFVFLSWASIFDIGMILGDPSYELACFDRWSTGHLALSLILACKRCWWGGIFCDSLLARASWVGRIQLPNKSTSLLIPLDP